MPMPRRSSTLPLLALLSGLAAPAPLAAAEATTIVFAAGVGALDAEARGALDALARRLAADPKSRLRLVAYAAPAANGDDPRRLSLARARAAWSHLTSLGVPGDRIAVRAHGDQAAGAAPDRLDLFVEAAP